MSEILRTHQCGLRFGGFGGFGLVSVKSSKTPKNDPHGRKVRTPSKVSKASTAGLREVSELSDHPAGFVNRRLIGLYLKVTAQADAVPDAAVFS